MAYSDMCYIYVYIVFVFYVYGSSQEYVCKVLLRVLYGALWIWVVMTTGVSQARKKKESKKLTLLYWAPFTSPNP